MIRPPLLPELDSLPPLDFPLDDREEPPSLARGGGDDFPDEEDPEDGRLTVPDREPDLELVSRAGALRVLLPDCTRAPPILSITRRGTSRVTVLSRGGALYDDEGVVVRVSPPRLVGREIRPRHESSRSGFSGVSTAGVS